MACHYTKGGGFLLQLVIAGAQLALPKAPFFRETETGVYLFWLRLTSFPLCLSSTQS